jgi:hypothetical protein
MSCITCVKIERDRINPTWIQEEFLPDPDIPFPGKNHEIKSIISDVVNELMAESTILHGGKNPGLNLWLTKFLSAKQELDQAISEHDLEKAHTVLKQIFRLQLEFCFIGKGYKVASSTTFGGEGDFVKQERAAAKMSLLFADLSAHVSNITYGARQIYSGVTLASTKQPSEDTGIRHGLLVADLKSEYVEIYQAILAEKRFSFMETDSNDDAAAA